MWDGVGSRVGRETVVSMGHLNCDWGGSNGAFVNSGLDVMGWLRKMTEKPSWWDVSKEGFGITSVVLLSGAGLGKTYFGEGRFHSWVGMLQDSRWWQWGGGGHGVEWHTIDLNLKDQGYKHYNLDVKGSWQSEFKESHKVLISTAAYSPGPEKDFPLKGRVSPAPKLVQLCSGSPDVTTPFLVAEGFFSESVTALFRSAPLHPGSLSGPRKVLHPNRIQEIY